MKVKRIIAYIIDIFIISMLSYLLYTSIFTNNAELYQEKSESYLKEIIYSGSSELDENELINMNYELAKLQNPRLIINLGLSIFYFSILSYIWNGKTLGKKLLKIKVVPIKGKNLNSALYILRGILITNSIFNLLDIINTYAFTGMTWYKVQEMIAYGKIILSSSIIGVMIFRDDERGLHDLICKTNVIEDKKKELEII